MDALTITDQHLPQAWVLHVHGEVDAFSAPQLREHHRASRAHRADHAGRAVQGVGGFVLDLSGVPFMDSAGLGACLALLKRARSEGEQVAIVAAASTVVKLLDLTGVPQVYPVHASVEQAVASIGQ